MTVITVYANNNPVDFKALQEKLWEVGRCVFFIFSTISLLNFNRVHAGIPSNVVIGTELNDLTPAQTQELETLESALIAAGVAPPASLAS